MHNALTSYYYLLLKRMRMQGSSLDDINLVAAAEPRTEQIIPLGSQVKKYQSIEP